MSEEIPTECEKIEGKTCQEHNDGYYCKYCVRCLYTEEEK
jgi:hypothetical protein